MGKVLIKLHYFVKLVYSNYFCTNPNENASKEVNFEKHIETMRCDYWLPGCLEFPSFQVHSYYNVSVKNIRQFWCQIHY